MYELFHALVVAVLADDDHDTSLLKRSASHAVHAITRISNTQSQKRLHLPGHRSRFRLSIMRSMPPNAESGRSGTDFRARQEPGQVRSRYDIVNQAEGWPPERHARIGDQLTVDEVKHAVRC